MGGIVILGFKLSADRYEEIKGLAINMFEKYDVKCLPISGFEIASKMGIKVVPYSAYPNQRTRELMLKESEDGFVGENNGVELSICV